MAIRDFFYLDEDEYRERISRYSNVHLQEQDIIKFRQYTAGLSSIGIGLGGALATSGTSLAVSAYVAAVVSGGVGCAMDVGIGQSMAAPVAGAVQVPEPTGPFDIQAIVSQPTEVSHWFVNSVESQLAVIQAGSMHIMYRVVGAAAEAHAAHLYR